MEGIVTKQELEELKKIKGKSRSISFKTQADFIFEKEGAEGLKKLERAMERLGYPLKYQRMKSLDWHPLWLLVLNMIVIQRIFGYDEEDIKGMGAWEAKHTSLIIRIFMKYFGSVEMIMSQVAKMWGTHYSEGALKVVNYNKKEKFIIMRLTDFSCHPIFCKDLEGWFPSMLEMIIGTDATAEETKCVHKGDDFHEFLLKW